MYVTRAILTTCVTDDDGGKKGGCSLTFVEETESLFAVIIAMVFGMFLVFRTRED
jgi:hypothetical protein